MAEFDELYKIIGGSFTLLDIAPSARSVPLTIRVQANGSMITGEFDSSETISVTDTSITGNVRTAVRPRNVPDAMRLDNFEAADLAVGGTILPQMMQLLNG